MLNVQVCAVYVCVCACKRAHGHLCFQMTVHFSDCRTFISGPQTPSADLAYLPQRQSPRSSSVYCFLALPLAHLLSHSSHITVISFHFILSQTPFLSIVSVIRRYYQQQWITESPVLVSPPPLNPAPQPSSTYSHLLSPLSILTLLTFRISHIL